MRILHVVDLAEHSSIAPLACASAVRRLPARHVVWTIGPAPVPGSFPRVARAFTARLGRAGLAWPALRRPLRDAASRFDIITCWSPGALSAVNAALPRTRPGMLGIFTGDPPARRTILQDRALHAPLRRAPILCFSEHAARQWSIAGATDARVAPAFIRSLRDELPSRDRARATLGVEPRERVIGLLADPPSHGDARRFAYLTGLLSVGGTPTVGLVHARGAQMRRAARFLRECGRAWRLIAWSGSLADVLPACDVALCDIQVSPTHPLRTPADKGGPRLTADALGLSLAAAAGVPLILPHVPLADELRHANFRYTTAADTSALSLASAAFAALDEPPAPVHPAPGAPDSPDAMDTLLDVWNEMINVRLPGFPLTPGTPIASVHRALPVIRAFPASSA